MDRSRRVPGVRLSAATAPGVRLSAATALGVRLSAATALGVRLSTATRRRGRDFPVDGRDDAATLADRGGTRPSSAARVVERKSVEGRGTRGSGRTRAEACATTSPVGNAKKCREAIACVGEGGGWDAWTPQGLVARGRGVSDKTGISIPRGRGRSRRARGRTRGLARSRRGISRESSSARDRVSANMSSARAAFAGQRASDREPDRVPLGVFFCFRRCRDARATKMCQACANSSPRGRFDEKRSIWGI